MSCFEKDSVVTNFSSFSAGVGTRARLEETPQQAEERLDKMRGAVRTLLECVGEDPDREGLLDTPSRYAKALMFFTKGYQSNVEDIGEIYTRLQPTSLKSTHYKVLY